MKHTKKTTAPVDSVLALYGVKLWALDQLRARGAIAATVGDISATFEGPPTSTPPQGEESITEAPRGPSEEETKAKELEAIEMWSAG